MTASGKRFRSHRWRVLAVLPTARSQSHHLIVAGHLAITRIRIYTNYVAITFDASKSERNLALRGIPFDLASAFAWDSALIAEDLRKDYGESRFQALGLIEGRLYMLVFTPRKDKVHVISLQKANDREVKRYEAQA